MEVDEAHDQVEVMGELEPGRDVGVVVEPRDEISSPAESSRPTVRVSAKFSVVMFGPNADLRGLAPRKRAAVSCAAATSASLRRLVSNGPPRFAFDSRR